MYTEPARPRRLRSVVAGLVVGLAAAAALVVAVALVAVSLFDPFATTETERANPVVLTELQDLQRFTAASGRFSTIVDVETDAKYLPDVVKGERTVFIAEGDVEAYVDFAALTEDGIVVSEDGTSVTVRVPEPQLTEPRLDPDATYVAARDRGLLDRLEDAVTDGEPTDDQALHQRADEKLTEAADQSELRDQARENTETFLVSMLGAMGYEQVTVEFVAPSGSTA
ncbi:MAG: DUF4230 domain-containing protein [Acidimicrobiales bacterium]|jgi:hypothetical protein|nr:DUF4230 domain-containing protein [Acidimicrobiales bacterium]